MIRVAAFLVGAVTLGALAVAPAKAQETTDSLRSSVIFGQVTGAFQGTRAPLPYALVVAVSSSGRRTAVADDAGNYRLEGLPPGNVLIRVEHAGHDAFEVEVLVARGSQVRTDLELRAHPVALDALEVVGDLRIPEAGQRDMEAPPRPEIEVQALDLTPGVGSPGLLDAVQAMPGNDPANATDVLYMRGSTTDLKLVLLDGAPVYTPFHVAGLMRSFEPGVLGSAALHVGGAPARYDGGLTHILDLETRRPRRDRLRGSGSIDLISASTAIEGPLGERAGFLASARALHGLGSAPLRGDRPYGYSDLLLSMEVEPLPGHLIRGTGFLNEEAVLLDFQDAPDNARWSNQAVSATYEGNLRGARIQLLAAASGYDAALPLQPTAPADQAVPTALLATAATDRVRLVAEAAWGQPSARTLAGVSHERIDAAFEARELSGGPLSGTRTSTHSSGAYIDATRLLAAGVTLRAGLRADQFSVGGLRFAPRATLAWAFDPKAIFSVAAGRYHQPTRTPDAEVERTLSEVVETDLLASELLPVATADHVVVSLDQTMGTNVRLGLQGFWKRYEGLESAPDETIRSSGIDLRLSSVGDMGVFWLGYSLSWFWSTEDLSGYSSDFAGRHLLSAGLSGGLGGPIRGEVRVAYGAGLPYTAIPFGLRGNNPEDGLTAGDPGDTPTAAQQDPPLVGGLDEEFLRVDVELHALLTPIWGGHQWSIRPYVRLLNALDRRDALFYTFQPWRSDSLTPLAERPVLPIFGVAFSF